MAIILDVANWLFRTKKVELTDEDKVKFGWIFNRFLAKRYPLQAAKLNHKNQNPIITLDLWRAFLEGQPYGNWIWDKTTKIKENLKKDEVEYLCRVWDLNPRDIKFLEERFPDEIDEELKYWKKQQKLK